MLFPGKWFREEDGTVRPTLQAYVARADGRMLGARFLIDSGADQTFFSYKLLRDLHWPASSLRAPQINLSGVGGSAGYVLLTTVLELHRDDGTPARLHAEFAAFTNPDATEVSLLGRDILDQFDVILSRRRNEILLLKEIHEYVVTQQ